MTRSRRFSVPWAPVALALLALWDLRAELQLLAEQFTWISLLMIPRYHLLAVTVLILTPSLIRQRR